MSDLLLSLKRQDSIGAPGARRRSGSVSSSGSGSGSFRKKKPKAQSDNVIDNLDNLFSMIDYKDLVFQEQIGKGEFGAVYYGTWHDRDVAIKELKVQDDEYSQKLVAREITTISNISHPNVVEFLGGSRKPSEDGKDKDSLLIVMEFMGGGDLHSLLFDNQEQQETLDWATRTNLAIDIASAMEYCHSLNIVHRDIKLQNLLIQNNLTKTANKVKVCDFGFARSSGADEQSKRMTYVGTDDYMAPEIIMGMEYGKEADVFSFGIVLAQILSLKPVGEQGYLSRTPQNLFDIDVDELRDSVSSQCPELLLDVCIECCQYEPEMRPTFSEILQRLGNLVQILSPKQQSGFHAHPVWSQIPFDDLVFGKIVGSGQFGSVYAGEFNGLKVAIKEMLLTDDEHVLRFLKREIEVLSEINHPNVVQFIGGSMNSQGKLFMVFEFMDSGDLRQLLDSQLDQESDAAQLTWLDRVDIAMDAATALNYCHQKNILHRDIKSDNILVSRLADKYVTKLCDFGFAREQESEEAKRMTFCGTDEYMSPELVMGEEYGKASDVFSFGVVLVELLTNKSPKEPGLLERLPQNFFQIEDFDPLRQAVLDGCPTPFLKLAIMCLQSEVEDRPDFAELLDLLRDIRSEVQESQQQALDNAAQTDQTDSSLDHLWNAIKIEELEFHKVVGKGEFGAVYRGFYQGMEVAIKEMYFTSQPEYMKYVEREIQVLSVIRHPNIIQFINACRTKSSKYYMVFEFMDGGDLSDLIESPLGKTLPWKDVLEIVIDICSAMDYCHKMDIVHRDIKAENILIQVTNNVRKAKVCDFGLARRQEFVKGSNQRDRRMTMVGTDNYMAPEVIMGEEYGSEADVFSFGLMLAELLAGRLVDSEFLHRQPRNFFEVDNDDVLNNVREGCPEMLVQMCLACLNYETSDRPTFQDILEGAKELLGELSAASESEVEDRAVVSDVWSTIEYSDLEFGQVMGRSLFGSVYRGKFNGLDVAIKELLVDDSQVEMEELAQGIHILCNLNHPNIVQYLGACRNNSGKLFIVTEFLNEGTVMDMLDSITAEDAVQVALDISAAMSYCHKQSPARLHFDIQPEHIFVQKVNDRYNYKLSNFSLTGTPILDPLSEKHLAPEAMLDMGYDSSVDVYAFGLTMIQLVFRQAITIDGDFLNRSPMDAFDMDWDPLTESVPEDCPEKLWDLTVQCVEYDASYRPTFDELSAAFANLNTSMRQDKGSSIGQEEESTLTSTSSLSVGSSSGQSDVTDENDPWKTVDYADLVFGTMVGKGQFGSVYRGEYRGLAVAIKEMFFTEDADVAKYIAREISVMSLVGHPNVVQFLGGATSPGGKKYIVLEFMTGGDLKDLIEALQTGAQKLTWPAKVSLLLDVANALQYCHSQDIIHRDIKPDNVLIEHHQNRQLLKAKVCDFGFARPQEQQNRRMTYCGTDDYMAPEIIMGMEYGLTADVFSFGMVMAELICQRLASQGFLNRSPQSRFDIDDQEYSEAIPDDCPDALSALCRRCLDYDEENRPDFQNVRDELRQVLEDIQDTKKQITEVLSLRKEVSMSINDFLRFWTNINYEDLKFEKILETGQFGDVYKGVLGNKRPVRIHEIMVETDSEQLMAITQLIRDLDQITHPNVEQFVGGCQSPEGRMYAVFNYRPGGQLREMLRNPNQKLTWTEKVALAVDVASGLAYIHGLGMEHKAIQSGNIFLVEAEEEDELPVAVITNIANRRKLSETLAMSVAESSKLGTDYVSQMLDEAAEGGDVFGFGIVLAELIANQPLSPKLLRRTAQGHILLDAEQLKAASEDDCPQDVFDLCLECCKREEDVERPTLDVLLDRLNSTNMEVVIDKPSKKQMPRMANEWKGVQDGMLAFQAMPPSIVFGAQYRQLPTTTGMVFRKGYYVGQIDGDLKVPHGYGEYFCVAEDKTLDTDTVFLAFSEKTSGFWYRGEKHGPCLRLSVFQGQGAVNLQTWRQGRLLFEHWLDASSASSSSSSSSSSGVRQKRSLFSRKVQTSTDDEYSSEQQRILQLEQRFQKDLAEGKYFGQYDEQGKKRSGMGAQVWEGGRAVFWGEWESDAPVRGWFVYPGGVFAGWLDLLGKFVFGTFTSIGKKDDVDNSSSQSTLMSVDGETSEQEEDDTETLFFSGLWSRKNEIAQKADKATSDMLAKIPLSLNVLVMMASAEEGKGEEAKTAIEDYYSRLVRNTGTLHRHRNLNHKKIQYELESLDSAGSSGGSGVSVDSTGVGSSSGSGGGRARRGTMTRANMLRGRSASLVHVMGRTNSTVNRSVKRSQAHCVNLSCFNMIPDSGELEAHPVKRAGKTCLLHTDRGLPLVFQLDVMSFVMSNNKALSHVTGCEQILLNLHHHQHSQAQSGINVSVGSVSSVGSVRGSRREKDKGGTKLSSLGQTESKTLRSMIAKGSGSWVTIPFTTTEVLDYSGASVLQIQGHVNPYELSLEIPALHPFSNQITQYVNFSMVLLLKLDNRDQASWWCVDDDMLFEVAPVVQSKAGKKKESKNKRRGVFGRRSKSGSSSKSNERKQSVDGDGEGDSTTLSLSLFAGK